MKSDYKRENLEITEFDTEDVITTSGISPSSTDDDKSERENAYGSFDDFDHGPGQWF